MVICCYGVQKLTSFLVLVLQLVKLRFQVSFTLNVKVTLCITKNSLVMPVLLFFYHSIWLRFHSLVSVVPVTWCTRAWVSIYYHNKVFCKVTFYSTHHGWMLLFMELHAPLSLGFDELLILMRVLFLKL